MSGFTSTKVGRALARQWLPPESNGRPTLAALGKANADAKRADAKRPEPFWVTSSLQRVLKPRRSRSGSSSDRR
jgi:hypothetical protein